jgi:hypothetical protein
MSNLEWIIAVPILILWAAFGLQVITEFIKHTGK